jgi:hypothetical protein
MEKTDSKREAMGQDEEKGEKSKDLWLADAICLDAYLARGGVYIEKGRSSFGNQENMTYMLPPMRV